MSSKLTKMENLRSTTDRICVDLKTNHFSLLTDFSFSFSLKKPTICTFYFLNKVSIFDMLISLSSYVSVLKVLTKTMIFLVSIVF